MNGYLSNISCSPLPFGLLSSQVSGNGITFSHVELPQCKSVWTRFAGATWFRRCIRHMLTRINVMTLTVYTHLVHIERTASSLQSAWVSRPHPWRIPPHSAGSGLHPGSPPICSPVSRWYQRENMVFIDSSLFQNIQITKIKKSPGSASGGGGGAIAPSMVLAFFFFFACQLSHVRWWW